MNHSKLHLNLDMVVGQIDPRIFGGFLEHMGRAVYDGVYKPESKHADEHGVRRDVSAALRELNFTAMRYPGGNFVSGYHWQDGVGPKDKRPTRRDLAWQSIETNQFGTDEFMRLSNELGWTPMFTVNLGTGTPEEARDWLEYCNGAAGTFWADHRVANGHADPYGIKLWCLGNEMDGPWQLGYVPAEAYAMKAQQTARLMKMFDPSVELVVCGSCATELPTYLEWDRKVLEYCYADVDYISLHSYVGNKEQDTEEYLAVGAAIDRQIEESTAVCRYVKALKRSKKDIYLSFDEWNVWYRARHGDHLDGRGKFAPHLLEEHYNLEDALVVAQFLNSFIRHADVVKIANLAQIVNVIAPLMTDGDELLFQTIFYALEMVNKRGRGLSLRTHVSGPSVASRLNGSVPSVDSSAVLDGDKLTVFLVNRSTTTTSELEIQIAGHVELTLLEAEVLTGKDPAAVNKFGAPPAVRSQDYRDGVCINGKPVVELPPLSFVAATFRVG
jgi:alpha-N-arabinofuranosidase